MTRLYLATSNAHKTQELRTLLAKTRFDIYDLNTVPDYVSPDETGTTFLDNARIKAKALHDYLTQKKNGEIFFTLADDSGLECDDLNGAPGVYSARFAGVQATDTDNNHKLIAALQNVTHLTREARYVCALVLITPTGEEKSFVETCAGHIVFEPSGINGFGYDPYFYLTEFDKTMAELSPEEKNRISHRGKALRRLIGELKIS